jgi:DNA-binding CsgD family transcriptional regulator
VIEAWTVMAELPPGGLGVAVEIGRIASSPGSAEQRAAALLEALRPLVPFQAGCIYLVEPPHDAWTLVSVGYPEAMGRFIRSPEHTAEIELIGYNRDRRPVRVRDLPVPPEQLRSWVEYLAPAGFREGLGVGLFTTDGRHLGLLGLNTDHPGHPTEAARDLVGMLAPVIAEAVDPLRSITEAARMVRGAVAGVVLVSGGEVLPLAGLPDHPALVKGSATLVAARHIARQVIHGSFLYREPDAKGYLRISVLASVPRAQHRWAAAVLVSPPGDLYGLTYREMQIVGLLIEGWSNTRIAGGLCIAERTVATHIEHILAKLGVASRTMAAARALRSGIYIPPTVTFPR